MVSLRTTPSVNGMAPCGKNLPTYWVQVVRERIVIVEDRGLSYYAFQNFFIAANLYFVSSSYSLLYFRVVHYPARGLDVGGGACDEERAYGKRGTGSRHSSLGVHAAAVGAARERFVLVDYLYRLYFGAPETVPGWENLLANALNISSPFRIVPVISLEMCRRD